MKGQKEVIDLLNRGLGLELTAVNQYLAQSKRCQHWGYHKLGLHLYADYQDERIHAEKIIARILFLEGVPNIQVSQTIVLGNNLQEMIEADLKLETAVVQFYNEVIITCNQLKDAGSSKLAEFLLLSSENDVEELESQLTLIKQIGLENYQIEMIGEKQESKD
jgi:bacterioferritin